MKKTALVYSGAVSFVAVDLASNGVADGALAVQIGHRNPGLVLLQNPDDLLFLPRAASIDDVWPFEMARWSIKRGLLQVFVR